LEALEYAMASMDAGMDGLVFGGCIGGAVVWQLVLWQEPAR
jgi:hypothetical protein